MWARHSSAQFDQGSGRPACNNPYHRDTDEKLYKEMKASGLRQITYEDFLKIIKPSFLAVDEDEDLDAILAKTHLIVLTESGVYHRVASTSKDPVNFIEWDSNQPKDLMAPSQHAIFKKVQDEPTSP